MGVQLRITFPQDRITNKVLMVKAMRTIGGFGLKEAAEIVGAGGVFTLDTYFDCVLNLMSADGVTQAIKDLRNCGAVVATVEEQLIENRSATLTELRELIKRAIDRNELAIAEDLLSKLRDYS